MSLKAIPSIVAGYSTLAFTEFPSTSLLEPKVTAKEFLASLKSSALFGNFAFKLKSIIWFG